MSFDAINNIAQAELDAKAAVAAAEQKAKQLIAEAEDAGRASVEAAIAKADGELEELRRRAGEKSETDAQRLRDELATKKAVLLAKAEAKLEKAAALVVERIVND